MEGKMAVSKRKIKQGFAISATSIVRGAFEILSLDADPS